MALFAIFFELTWFRFSKGFLPNKLIFLEVFRKFTDSCECQFLVINWSDQFKNRKFIVPLWKANQSIAVPILYRERGKSGQYRASCFLTGRSHFFKDLGTESAAERKTTFDLSREKVKRWGKSSPLRWQHRRQGKPHELKDHVN